MPKHDVQAQIIDSQISDFVTKTCIIKIEKFFKKWKHIHIKGTFHDNVNIEQYLKTIIEYELKINQCPNYATYLSLKTNYLLKLSFQFLSLFTHVSSYQGITSNLIDTKKTSFISKYEGIGIWPLKIYFHKKNWYG